MSEENPTPTTEVPAAEPATATPATAAPNPEQKPTGFDERKSLPGEQRPQEDWRYAYATTQKTVQKLHTSNEETRRRLSETTEELRAARETLNLLAKQNLNPEQVAALEERQKFSAERAHALQAAQTLDQSVQATITLVDRVMASAGLSEEDRKAVYEEAKNTNNVQEWAETVHALASQRIERAVSSRISKAEGEIRAKTAAEIKAEAEALAAKQRREEGVDKVDTGSGGTTSNTKSLAEMNDAEYAVFSEQKRQEREQRRMKTLR